jgi:predicted phage terminase large subunit-like protein
MSWSTHIEQAIGPFLEKRIREEKLWSMAIEPLVPGRRDKQLRARPIQGRMRQGKVLFPKGAPWMEWLQNELLRFPSSPMDDGVDAMAWIGQMLNMVQYTPPPKSKPKSWKDRLTQFVNGALNVKNPAMAA